MTQISQSLEVRAGPRALAHLREHGLRPHDIDIVPGAAGGPKGLGLARLDEWLFADWLPQSFAARTAPVQLIGASIGAWRFAAVCRGHNATDTRAALSELAEGYCAQHYPRNVSAASVSADARELLGKMFRGRELEVLTHPHYRLNILVVRGKGILQREQRFRTATGFAMAALANAAGRKHLSRFLDRHWFFDGRELPLIAEGERFDHFLTHTERLTTENFADALLASGSIPLVLEGVDYIAGARAGTYWDGGIIDYHLHLPYARSAGLTLYPHFTGKIIPGWLDKVLPWRKAAGPWLDNLILLSPSPAYLARLPHGKLPDRNDFKRYIDDFTGRQKYWHFAMDESARLRDEFAAMVANGSLAAHAQPI
ncbi:MAG: patatin-like phospholipase family protein [Betaproteobacteria bacterium]|nr:patatin-like phospholipase family protein [Betaproteobacteria bacterium]